MNNKIKKKTNNTLHRPPRLTAKLSQPNKEIKCHNRQKVEGGKVTPILAPGVPKLLRMALNIPNLPRNTRRVTSFLSLDLKKCPKIKNGDGDK